MRPKKRSCSRRCIERFCWSTLKASPAFVMAGLVPAIHVFRCMQPRRGCPARGRARRDFVGRRRSVVQVWGQTPGMNPSPDRAFSQDRRAHHAVKSPNRGSMLDPSLRVDSLRFAASGCVVFHDKIPRPAATDPLQDAAMCFAARNGMVGVKANYRLAPAHPSPSGARDVAAAPHGSSRRGSRPADARTRPRDRGAGPALMWF